MFVKEVKPKIIRNSRREKTILIMLKTYDGKFFSSAPSGKSRGSNEVEPYNEKGIKASIGLLKVFRKLLINKNFLIKKIDDIEILNKLIKNFESRYGVLGGNVVYVLQTVFLKAAAEEKKKELWEFIMEDKSKIKFPMPVGNCIGGAMHSKKINRKKPDFQEFLLIPNKKTFSRAVTLNILAYNYARKLLKSRRKNDEGAHMTEKSNEEVLEILKIVAGKYNLRMGVDIAASTFYKKGYYDYKNKELIRDRVDQSDYMERLVKKYNLFYLEDPMNEKDFSGFKEINNLAGGKTLVVGDDLTTTNLKFARRAVESKSINAMIIKPNQIGDILEVKKVVDFCKKHNIKMIFSHRSGETMDDALADYCIGFGGDFIKTGISGRERLIKLKRVMEIEKGVKG
ncbi:MAG: enolase C-terminal domain-like protein [Nanoarchaeota archaeon]|nr:enolase C-terminal domain-like protein [Nanoarchaeota archaeon]